MTARTPSILLATIETPTPEPHAMTARSAPPRRHELRGLRGVGGVVDGPGRIGPDVDDVVARGLERRLDVLLEVEAGVVGADGDLHDSLISARPSSIVVTGA